MNEVGQQEPFKDPVWEAAVKLALDYHKSCERFDRKICTARNENGVVIPANWPQRKASDKFVRMKREKILEEAKQQNVPRQILFKAIRKLNNRRWTGTL